MSGYGTSVWTGRALQAEYDRSGDNWSRSSVFGPLMERLAPGHHGYPGTSDLIRVEAPGGPHVPPDRGRDGETVSPSPSIRLADLGRNPIVLVIEVSLVLHFRRLLGRLVSVQSRRRRLD